MQLNPESGREIPFEQSFPVHLQNSGGSKAAHQRLAHLCGIGTRLRRKHQSFADGLDCEGNDDNYSRTQEVEKSGEPHGQARVKIWRRKSPSGTSRFQRSCRSSGCKYRWRSSFDSDVMAPIDGAFALTTPRKMLFRIFVETSCEISGRTRCADNFFHRTERHYNAAEQVLD
jgi:hypothetical protein